MIEQFAKENGMRGKKNRLVLSLEQMVPVAQKWIDSKIFHRMPTVINVTFSAKTKEVTIWFADDEEKSA